MKCQAVQLLVCLLLSSSTGAPRQRRAVSNVKKIGSRGIPCQNSGEKVCHGSTVIQYGQNYAKVCNDGEINLMRIYPGYAGPAPCTHRGETYCSGDKVAGGGSVFVEQLCDNGEVFFVNKITGLKFQKGRLSGSSGKEKKSDGKKNVKNSPGNSNEVSSNSTTSDTTAKSLVMSTTPTATTTATTTTTTSITTTTTTTTTTKSTTITTSTTTTTKPTTTTTTSIRTTPPTAAPTSSPTAISAISETIPRKTSTNKTPTELPKFIKDFTTTSATSETAPSFDSSSSTLLPVSMVSMEYVNTILEENMPDAKVLQCWTQYSICFIQIGPDLPMLNIGQDLP